MLHKNLLIVLCFCSTLLLLHLSCNKSGNDSENFTTPKVIAVSDVAVSLPEGLGKDLVVANCVSCHSLQYIEMQPDFSKATWEKIVKKMIINFNAPISDTIISAKIVDYLFAVKGKK